MTADAASVIILNAVNSPVVVAKIANKDTRFGKYIIKYYI
jgi:hypothetical protein